MDGTSQTSFIPKRPISPSPVSYENRGVSIVTIVCIIVFFGAVALSVGSYLYRSILERQLEQKTADLEKAKNSFDLETIRDLKRLDNRMTTAESLLQNHIAFSSYFELLEEVTLRSVRFSSLFIQDKVSGSGVSGSSVLSFKLSGYALGYSGIALQSDLFTKARGRGIIEPVFTGLSLDDKGAVKFNAEADIDRKSLLYKDTLAGSTNSASSPARASSASTTVQVKTKQ